MGALVQDENGESRPIIMGSYGIGLERNMAAIVEASHDEKGIIWPVSVAPYAVVVTVLRADDPATMAAAEALYGDLTEAGVETLVDDRLDRPGVKFADAELIGIPFRVTVGPRGVAAGTVELTVRAGLSTEDVLIGEVVDRLATLLGN
jgi:prolyl-tRNA synthetase